MKKQLSYGLCSSVLNCIFCGYVFVWTKSYGLTATFPDFANAISYISTLFMIFGTVCQCLLVDAGITVWTIHGSQNMLVMLIKPGLLLDFKW